VVFRTDAIRGIERFDPDLGAGANTPWGAGEGADLPLQMLDAGARHCFDPVLSIAGGGRLTRVTKMREFEPMAVARDTW